MGFTLFILTNAALFIRPGEIVPGLENASVYLYLILACLVVSLPQILEQLSWESLSRQPITLCVLGLLGTVVMSHLARGDTSSARQYGMDFAKNVLYYLLLVSLVDTPERLRSFLMWLVVFVLSLTLIAVLQYHGYVEIPSLTTLQERRVDRETGEMILVARLRSTGFFNDPNDLCLVLTLGTLICLYFFNETGGVIGWPWLLPAALFVYALLLTKSRGGVIGLAIGLLVLCRFHFGWKKSLLVASLAAPAALLLIGGRQASIDVGDREDTAQQRIQLWAANLACFRQSPIFGVGAGQSDEATGEGLVAHNSFVTGFAELGFFGGAFFAGGFFLAFRGLEARWRRGEAGGNTDHRLCPYLAAMVAAFAGGLLSLTRNYAVYTYITLGLATVYLSLTAIDGGADPVPVVSERPLLVRLGLVGVATLGILYAAVQLLVQWG